MFFRSTSLSLHRHAEALGFVLILVLGFRICFVIGIVAAVALTFVHKAVFCGFLVRFLAGILCVAFGVDSALTLGLLSVEFGFNKTEDEFLLSAKPLLHK